MQPHSTQVWALPKGAVLDALEDTWVATANHPTGPNPAWLNKALSDSLVGPAVLLALHTCQQCGQKQDVNVKRGSWQINRFDMLIQI